MGWNDWIYIEPQPHPLTHRSEEVEAAVNEELAQNLQSRLRVRVDMGVDLRSAKRAEAIRVASEGNQLVISEKSQDEVLADGDHSEVDDLDDLFIGGARTPELTEDGQLVYRSIALEDVLGTKEWQDNTVDRAVRELLDQEFVDATERAVKRVELDHPTDKAR